MLKRILLPLDTSPYSEAAMEYAINIAKEHNATIYGMTIMDIPDIEDLINAIPIGGFYWAEKLKGSKIKDAKIKLNEVSRKFAHKMGDKNVNFTMEEIQGLPSSKIIENSKFYDLIIIGLKTYFEFETSDTKENSLDELLNHSITPVLAVPKTYREIKNILIAYDGSFAASRALQRFTHLATKKDYSFILLTSSTKIDKASSNQIKIVSYLESYGIKNIKTIITDKNINQVIKNDYMDWADLVVIGAHSKNKFEEFFVGSLTKELININKKPLFIGF
ncbi:hypothetical protein MNBD_IGNAVI01-2604 [hydrothermal vent metagenome]|uniref:UspA domain-containing protein n=1 Tax=hydrothermal vent metagenome TaxID=652676 RepID=A0A3B1CK00_9ZZZZ